MIKVKSFSFAYILYRYFPGSIKVQLYSHILCCNFGAIPSEFKIIWVSIFTWSSCKLYNTIVKYLLIVHIWHNDVIIELYSQYASVCYGVNFCSKVLIESIY